MGADDRPHIIDVHLFYAAPLLQKVRQVPGILRAVPVGDEHDRVVVAPGQLPRLFGQGLDGCLPAPDLAHRDQPALVVHMEDGLDGQHGAHYGGGGADTTAPLQIHQIVDGKPVAQMQPVFLQPPGQILQGHAGLPLFRGMEGKQPLAQGGAQAVYHQDLPVRIAFLQLPGGNDCGLIGGGKAGRKGQRQHILAALQNGHHGVLPLLGVDGGGGRRLSGPQTVVECFQAAVIPVGVGFPPEGDGKRQGMQTQLLIALFGKIAAGIGKNPVRHTIAPFLFSPVRAS